MFKKLILSLSVLFLLSTSAHANSNVEPVLSPYVGADIGYTFASHSGFPINIHVGLDLISGTGFDLGAEVYFQRYNNNKNDYTNFTKTYKQSLFGLDVLAYQSATDTIRYYGGLGLSYHLHSIEYKYNSSSSDQTYKDNKLGFNIMSGAQFYLSDNVSLRASMKYLFAHSHIDVLVGANYHF